MSVSSSLSQEDAKRLELSYSSLYALQRKNLAFLNALGEYEKKKFGSDGKTSRIAFIVTPLMVNHYNHMHQVYRASMYGKVPDLCDQTGGIMCADLGALREELASHATNLNRSLTTTYRTATLPNVQFNFKAARDNVLESAVRMLDSIEIKQPDLTHSIRDDYIQNVRAIQESLTNALEKSRERSAELQSRLSEALRKLKSTEKIIASMPDGAERLRKEVFRLKEQIIKQQGLVLEQRVEYDSNTLRLRESESECNLLRELMKRINEQTKEGAEGLKSLRVEMHKYTEEEMKKLRDDYLRVQHELTDRVKNTIARTKKENEDAMELCRSLMSRDMGDTDVNERLLRLQQDYQKLENENAELKRQLAGSRQEIGLNRNTVDAETASECYTIDDSSNSCITPISLQKGGETPELMDFESIVYENVAQNMSRAQNEAESAAILDRTIQKYNVLLNEFKSREEFHKSKQERIEEGYVSVRTDLNSIYLFFTDPDNVDAALKLEQFFNTHNLEFKSEYGNLTSYLLELKSKGNVTTNQSHIATLNRTITYSEELMHSLLYAIDSAYNDIVGFLQLETFSSEVVAPENMTNYFKHRFGKPLKENISLLVYSLGTCKKRVEDLEREGTELRAIINEHNTSQPEAVAPVQPVEDLNGLNSNRLLKAFDGDPTIFEEILQNVWARHETDRLHRLLDTAYCALALDRAMRYETYPATRELKLYNLVEYTVLTNHIRSATRTTVRTDLVNPKLKEKDYFLKHFISQIGNVQIENYINTLDLNKRNQLALILFNDFYIPIVNKESYVMSIEGPFANFNMIYKV